MGARPLLVILRLRFHHQGEPHWLANHYVFGRKVRLGEVFCRSKNLAARFVDYLPFQNYRLYTLICFRGPWVLIFASKMFRLIRISPIFISLRKVFFFVDNKSLANGNYSLNENIRLLRSEL
jgi:hypothetical protein